MDKGEFQELEKLDTKELLLWHQYFKNNFELYSKVRTPNMDKLKRMELNFNKDEFFNNMSLINAILQHRYQQILSNSY